MANVADIRPGMTVVSMVLGEEERTLQFDMNAFAELENRFGSIDAAMEKLSQGRIADVRLVLWASLIHNEVVEFDEVSGEPLKYGITPYQVGGWIKNPMMLKEVSEKLAEAMGFAIPEVPNSPEVQAKLDELTQGQDVKNVLNIPSTKQ